MTLNLEELDAATRASMLAEFNLEEASGNAYRGELLSDLGRTTWATLMSDAISSGDDGSLVAALQVADYWLPSETYSRNGVVRERAINLRQASERLGTSEFNTWYVRGLTRKLINEGVTDCEVYRAAAPKWDIAACTQHEGQIYPVTVVYAGHRRRYWPSPGDETAFSIPFQPGCHHTVRRI